MNMQEPEVQLLGEVELLSAPRAAWPRVRLGDVVRLNNSTAATKDHAGRRISQRYVGLESTFEPEDLAAESRRMESGRRTPSSGHDFHQPWSAPGHVHLRQATRASQAARSRSPSSRASRLQRPTTSCETKDPDVLAAWHPGARPLPDRRLLQEHLRWALSAGSTVNLFAPTGRDWPRSTSSRCHR
jgi:hypothetical protein